MITQRLTGDNNMQVRGYDALISSYADHFLLHEEPFVDARDATALSRPKAPSESIYLQILRDWAQLTGQPRARAELTQWRLDKPALAGLTEFTAIAAMSRSDAVDDLFTALLELHQNGSQLAGQALLAQMVPKLRSMTRYARVSAHSGSEYQERAAATVCAFMEVIATYRGTGRSVPGALSLKTLGLITKDDQSVGLREYPVDHVLLQSYRDVGDKENRFTDDFSAISADSLLSWAVKTSVISDLERTLIVRAYLIEEGADLPALATEFNLSYAALRQRLHRAVGRIRNAVCEHAGVAVPSTKRAYLYRKAAAPTAIAS